MVKQVQELIDKIKQEGYEAAQKKAQGIESEAVQKAKTIIAQAEKQAKDIVEKAQKQADQFQKSSQAAIRQASRDTILDLKKEIQEMLKRLILQETQVALTPEALAQMITTLVHDFHKKDTSSDIKVALNSQDLQNLKKGFLAKLKDELHNNLQLRPSDEINKGFVISFDEGKSSFDFSDESLAEYMSGYLNQELYSILKKQG